MFGATDPAAEKTVPPPSAEDAVGRKADPPGDATGAKSPLARKPRLRIGDLVLDGVVGLAPMAGFTEPVFRAICREQGAAFVVTELVSSEGLLRAPERTKRYLRFAEEERPLGMQLFGSDPQRMAEATRVLVEHRPDFIDINMGCPVPKVVSKEAGAALLRNPRAVSAIARAVVRAAGPVPVTAKIRSGWDRRTADVEGIGRRLEDAGVAAIAIHARTRSERFGGKADWSDIRRLKEAVSIPVIGNGDVRSADDALRMLTETGCDGVLIGRGALGNPWIFRQARALLEEGRHLPPPTRGEVLRLAREHLRRSVADRGLPWGLLEMRKTLAAYLRGFPRASTVRRLLFTEDTVEGVERILEEYGRTLGEEPIPPAAPGGETR